MAEVNDGLTPFQVQLRDFDFFEPRVVFVHVEKNEALTMLQKEVVNRCRKELNLDNANYRNQAFHPHITIGFRDLKKPKFYEAKQYYEPKSFQADFEVNRICLLKHNGKKWNVIN